METNDIFVPMGNTILKVWNFVSVSVREKAKVNGIDDIVKKGEEDEIEIFKGFGIKPVI